MVKVFSNYIRLFLSFFSQYNQPAFLKESEEVNSIPDINGLNFILSWVCFNPILVASKELNDEKFLFTMMLMVGTMTMDISEAEAKRFVGGGSSGRQSNNVSGQATLATQNR